MRLVAWTVVALLCGCSRAPPPPGEPVDHGASAGARRIEADVRFLADDLLEGREAATRGHELAALYVAQRMRAIGLAPAGEDGSYTQRVPMLRATRVDGQLLVTRDGATTALRLREQFLPALNYHGEDMTVRAPAVFVGQAVHAPALDIDHFRGVDVRGKIAVLLAGAPAALDGDERAFHASMQEKLSALSQRGAVGAVFIDTPADEARAPWAHSAAGWARPGMRLRDAQGRGIDTFPALRVVAQVSAAAADAIVGTAGQSVVRLSRAAQAGTLAAFDLPGTIALSARTRITAVESRNVVAVLRGSDARLRGEHVVFSAHLDHLGTRAGVTPAVRVAAAPMQATALLDDQRPGRPQEDRIFNGALDNALGVAIMLEAAQQLATSPARPKRSLLFVAVTAEEKGLLGAQWFVAHPTVPAGSLVANVNLDMPMLLTPTRDVVPVGLGHSSLRPLLRKAARDVGVALSPDPFPGQSIFVRSDQYAFVRAGIPAVYLMAGVDGAGVGDDAGGAMRDFLRDDYHQPGDDAAQPIQYADAARLARLTARIAQLAGDAAQPPAWNPGDFFGERFGRRRGNAEAAQDAR